MNPGAVPPARIDELLLHRDRVRSLARALAREGVAAEDVEQDAWLLALRAAGRSVDAPRAWLAGVVRNVARNARRARARRERHELAASPRGSALPVDEAVARTELHELVVRAVLELDEPFRSAVILRYLDGLGPREVAVRTGVPVETVRSRVRRGVARVRAALDARFDGDALRCSASLLALAGVGAGSSPATKGVVMASASKKSIAIVSAMLLLAGAAGLLVAQATDRRERADETPGSASPEIGNRTAERGARRRVDPGATQDAAAGHGAAADESAVGVDLDTAVADALRGALTTSGAPTGARDVVRVTDATGKPVAGARVELRRAPSVGWPSDYAAVLSAMLAEPELLAQGITDSEGGVRLPELASEPRAYVRVAKDGHGATTIRHGAGSAGVAVALGDRHDVTGTIRFVGGEPQAGLIVLLTTGDGPPVVNYRTETTGDGRFAIADAAAGRYGAWVAWRGGLPVHVGAVNLPEDRAPVLSLRLGGRITGHVRRAATGDTVAGVRVLALGAGAYIGQATTDDDGAYELRLVGDDDVKRLTAWKDGLAEVAFGGAPFSVGSGVERVADFEIFAGGKLVGVVRGPEGPLGGVSVQVWTSDHGYITNTTTETAADGSYVVDGLRPGVALVLAAGATNLVHPGQPSDSDRWRALLEDDLDPRCAATIVEGGVVRLDVTLEEPPKRATAAR